MVGVYILWVGVYTLCFVSACKRMCYMLGVYTSFKKRVIFGRRVASVILLYSRLI